MVATKTSPSATTPEPTVVTATELAKNLSDILNRVKYHGEHFEVRRNGETIAILAPRIPEKIVTMRDLIDFLRNGPRPDDEWVADMEAVLAERPMLDPKDFPEWPE